MWKFRCHVSAIDVVRWVDGPMAFQYSSSEVVVLVAITAVAAATATAAVAVTSVLAVVATAAIVEVVSWNRNRVESICIVFVVVSDLICSSHVELTIPWYRCKK